MSRTLIVYLHGIGDNIMLSGVLKEYCRLHPDEVVDLMVLNPECAAIWLGNPHVGESFIYSAPQPYFWNPIKFYGRHLWQVRRSIRELNQDGRYQRVLFPTIQTLPEIVYHITGTYGRHKIVRLCRDLDVPAQLYPYDLYVAAAEAAAAGELLSRVGATELAVLHPFSGHARKRLTVGDIGEILRVLHASGLTTLVVGAANEKAKLDPGWKTESAFGLSFGVLIEVLRHAKIFVGADSAIAHLAGFAQTHRIIIFSPKLKPERYLPVSEHGNVFVVPLKRSQRTRLLEDFCRTLTTSPPSHRT